jgi:hypothetical protein
MFFVVDKPRFQRLIAIARDDRRPGDQGKGGPFFRLEAHDGRLKLTGRQVEAEFPATVRIVSPRRGNGNQVKQLQETGRLIHLLRGH